MAYKYPPEKKETLLKDIVCQVGRTGAITPMAILDPVYVAGSKISKLLFTMKIILSRMILELVIEL